MAVKIKCSVSNCRFWQEMYCVAEVIEVNCNDGSTEAQTSGNTCCDTFRPQNESLTD